MAEATRSHLDPDNPLRRGDALSALHLVEYAAQAMAAHGALQAGGQAQRGMLAALRNIRLHTGQIHDIDGHVSEGYAPTFNALNIFRVPQLHSVTQVASYVAAERLSITGWIRER